MSGIIANNQPLADRLIEAGASCGEKLWQLPLDWDYADELKAMSPTSRMPEKAGRPSPPTGRFS